MELNAFIKQNNHGIMGNNNDHHDLEEVEDVNGSLSSFSEDEDEEGDDGSLCSASEDEFMVDAASSSSFSLGSSSSSSLNRRGLSKHFEGKSQSFTSLSNVKNLEDLIKPERPFRKNLKSSKSYGWGLDRSLLSTKASSKAITKKSSTRGGSFSSLKKMKRHSFSRNWPSFPPRAFGGGGLETIA